MRTRPLTWEDALVTRGEVYNPKEHRVRLTFQSLHAVRTRGVAVAARVEVQPNTHGMRPRRHTDRVR